MFPESVLSAVGVNDTLRGIMLGTVNSLGTKLACIVKPIR